MDQNQQATKRSPQSSETNTHIVKNTLVKHYVTEQRDRNVTRINTVHATNWYAGAKAVLDNPREFGWDAEPIRTIPSLNDFLEACSEALEKAA